MTHSLKAGLVADVVVVGSGIGGLVTALELAPRSVILVTQEKLGGQSSSRHAQGGIAAAWAATDSSASHAEDTLKAGDGLCDVTAVHSILADGRTAIERLQHYGVAFDRNSNGDLSLGLEAAHSHHRICHVEGDGTGKAVTETLCDVVRQTPSITVLEKTQALKIEMEGGRVSGLGVQQGDEARFIRCAHIVLATGGIGGLFHDTTNPLDNFGQGLLLAAEAGAVLSDVEFIQFHPTALDVPLAPRPLISEAVRGEGAILVNDQSERFLEDLPEKELASRDIVARAIAGQIASGRKVFLDARPPWIENFAKRFPSIDASCRKAGFDPARDLIPVCPVEHFHMGGVATDLEGRSSLENLWVVGEAASTGLHGANRLASNSLLEATIMATRAARAINEKTCDVLGGVIPQVTPCRHDPAPVRTIMQQSLGILRNEATLLAAIGQLLPMSERETAVQGPAKIALMIAVCALLRTESRGAHAREDYPAHQSDIRRSFLTWNAAQKLARDCLSSSPYLQQTGS